MTWTYSGDPATTSRDAVRFLVGDTDTTDQLVSDEEISWVLTQHSGVRHAAAATCEAIAAKFARQAEMSVDDVSIKAGEKAEHYRALAKELRAQAAIAGKVAKPFAGGISIADKDDREADTDRVKPFFRRDLHDVPGVFPNSDDEEK